MRLGFRLWEMLLVIHLLVLVAGGLLLALLLLGFRLQRGARQRQRWLHHLLFLALGVSSVAAAALCALQGRPFGVLALACALLLLMPLTRPGRADHWRLASLAALVFTVGAALAW